MALSLKPGVQFWGMHSRIVAILPILEQIYGRFGKDCVITSARDGQHKPNSKHYDGKALDLRTFTLTALERVDVHREIKSAVGADFDVILETDHIHIELDPKPD